MGLAKGACDSPAAPAFKSADTEKPIHFAGSVLGEGRHVCAFFGSPEVKYRVLLPFIKEGFARGERALHVVDAELRVEHVRQLMSAGIDVDAMEHQGHLEMLDWKEYCFPDRRFDEGRMLAKWDAVLEGAAQRGYPRTRVVVHLESFKQDVDLLLQYEADFNLFGRCNRDPVIITYDLTRHSSAFIIDVMRTHPIIVVGGILQENPFYIPPNQFLRELGQRRANAASASGATSN
jgi:DcmR-like sensory protein